MTKRCVFLCIVAFVCSLGFSQTILEPAILEKVQNAVFEVEVEKPSEGSLVYEKELPLYRIAFAIRNDRYHPLGTAFLVDSAHTGTNAHEFYSAAHVFNLYGDTLYGNFYLRDRDGKLYPIDKITGFSTDRDYISFTVKDFKMPATGGLQVQDSIKLNSQVFSVGNALGEGIVIRNGILTSQTYENENGEWKWLRFSAAASPGNSGGPLVDSNGMVLGIITMKSENENLNYALAFADTQKLPAGTGSMKQTFYYNLPNIFSERFYHKFSYQVPLPLPIDEVKRKLTAEFKSYTEQIVSSLKKQFSPDGKQGMTTGLGRVERQINDFLPNFPFTLYLSDTGLWQFGTPGSLAEQELEGNGSVTIGSMMGLTMGMIVKPDNVSLESLFLNPERYMEYLLAAKKITRNIGSESIGIESFGKPVETSLHQDMFQRTWQVNYYQLPFADAMVLSYALPLPSGLYVMYGLASTASILNGFTQDLAYLTDFVLAGYVGTLEQWQEFLSLPEDVCGKRPAVLQNLEIERLGDDTRIFNGTMGFTLSDSLFKVDDKTTISLSLGYRSKAEGLELENRSIGIYSDVTKGDYKYLVLSRKLAPSSEGQRETLQAWEQKRDKVAPYDGIPYDYRTFTYIDKVLYPKGVTFQNRNEATHVYVLSCELQGTGRGDEMQLFLQGVENSLLGVE